MTYPTCVTLKGIHSRQYSIKRFELRASMDACRATPGNLTDPKWLPIRARMKNYLSFICLWITA